MKTTFKSEELAHTWAHELAPEGNCQQSKSFRGLSFYSYAAEIGRIVKRKGKKAYLINQRSYSVTTSKHQSDMRGAIPHDAIKFYFDGDLSGAAPSALFDYAVQRAVKAGLQADKARKYKESYCTDKADWLPRAAQVNEFYGLRRKVDKAGLARLEKSIVAERERQKKAEKERQAKIEADNALYLERWKAGEMVSLSYSISRVYLRVFENEVQTSKGVRIPLPEAERAFRFIITRRDKGWHRNGEQFAIGQYHLDAVNAQGIVAGCHRIDWPEIERFAALQGWKK